MSNKSVHNISTISTVTLTNAHEQLYGKVDDVENTLASHISDINERVCGIESEASTLEKKLRDDIKVLDSKLEKSMSDIDALKLETTQKFALNSQHAHQMLDVAVHTLDTAQIMYTRCNETARLLTDRIQLLNEQIEEVKLKETERHFQHHQVLCKLRGWLTGISVAVGLTIVGGILLWIFA